MTRRYRPAADTIFVGAAVGLCLCASLLAGAAEAQTLGCKITVRKGAPPIDVLTCTGLTIESEPGANVHVLDRSGAGVPDAAQVEGGAVLVNVTPGRRSAFQILTPKAIASVRGTRYAVDATADKTSVFVATGIVGVTRADGGPEISLGKGEGVDVTDDPAPLAKKRWGAPRVAALMRRLGH